MENLYNLHIIFFMKILILIAVISFANYTQASAENDAYSPKRVSANKAIANPKTVNTDQYFSEIDTNMDGTISLDESRSYTDTMFFEADLNGDSKVTPSELNSFKYKKMQEMFLLKK